MGSKKYGDKTHITLFHYLTKLKHKSVYITMLKLQFKQVDKLNTTDRKGFKINKSLQIIYNNSSWS